MIPGGTDRADRTADRIPSPVPIVLSRQPAVPVLQLDATGCGLVVEAFLSFMSPRSSSCCTTATATASSKGTGIHSLIERFAGPVAGVIAPIADQEEGESGEDDEEKDESNWYADFFAELFGRG